MDEVGEAYICSGRNKTTHTNLDKEKGRQDERLIATVDILYSCKALGTPLRRLPNLGKLRKGIVDNVDDMTRGLDA